MATLYLDCDGFFASCEESADPSQRKRRQGGAPPARKPPAEGGPPGNRGATRTAN